MDQGLLLGLAEGLKSGMRSYQDERERQVRLAAFEDERARKKREENLQLKAAGVKYDEQGNLVADETSPGFLKQQMDIDLKKQQSALLQNKDRREDEQLRLERIKTSSAAQKREIPAYDIEIEKKAGKNLVESTNERPKQEDALRSANYIVDLLEGRATNAEGKPVTLKKQGLLDVVGDKAKKAFGAEGMRNELVVAAENASNQTQIALVKDSVGGAPSERETALILGLGYNPQLSNEENARRFKIKQDILKNKMLRDDIVAERMREGIRGAALLANLPPLVSQEIEKQIGSSESGLIKSQGAAPKTQQQEAAKPTGKKAFDASGVEYEMYTDGTARATGKRR